MSDSDPVVLLVQRALELKQAGQAFDIAELCGGRPEFIAAVEAALRMNETLPWAISGDPLLGARLGGRYRLDEYIGAGAMGKVFAGMDESLGREVAVKVLQHGVLATEQRQQRFEREAKVLASLDHPHIVRIFDYGATGGGFHYIVMERLRGAPLSAVLADQIEYCDAPRPPIWARSGETRRQNWLTQIAEWGVQLASALQSAHAEGIYHRDLKPSNIIIDSAGNACLLDYGIATREGDGSLTLGGTTLGTPWYMAPEQAADAKQVTGQVDVYGLCATLYHLATYQPPYDGDYRKVLLDLQSRDPRPPREVRPALPADLCAIIEKGMERDLRRRYHDAKELELDLRAFLAHMPVTARPLTRIGRRWRRIRARPTPWITGIAIGLGLLVAVFVSARLTRASRAALDDAAREYRALFAGFPPAVAFEGNLDTRPLLDPGERATDIARADRILELRPDDPFTRMIRAALWLDAGSIERSAADIGYFAKGNDTGFFRALLGRYRAADPAAKGAGAVDLAGLPEPETDIGCFVAAFHHARVKDYKSAEEYLQRAPHHFASRYLRLSVSFELGIADLRETDKPRRFVDTQSEAAELARVLGYGTARTYYFLGSARYGLSDYGSAIPPLRESVALAVSFHAIYNLAGALRRFHQPEEAAELYERAARLRPWNLNALRDLAQVKAQLGEFDEARAVVASLPAAGHLIEPWHRDWVLGTIEATRAEAQVATGNEDAARTSLARARAHFEAGQERAEGQAARRRLSGAIADLRSHLEPDRNRVLELLGRLHREPLNSHYLLSLNHALKRVPVDDEIRQQLTAVLQEMSNGLRSRREAHRVTDASAERK